MKNLPIIIALLLSGIFGCSKERLFEDKITDKIFISGDSLVFPSDALKKPVTLTIESGNDVPSTTLGETIIWIGNTNLMTNDRKVVSYPFDVEITELNTLKDFLLYDKTTVSSTNLLVDSRMINLKPTKNNAPLLVRLPYKTEISATSIDNKMRVYRGGQDANLRFNWQTGGAVISFSSKTGYTVTTSTLGWLDCGKPFTFTAGSTPVVFKSEYPALNKMRKFLLFPELKSMVSVYGSSNSINVPLGAKMVVVVIAKTNQGAYYSYIKNETVTQAMTEKIDLKHTSWAQFMSDISSF